MANSGTKHSNDSQFFITLDRADELHGKHTLFGRCVGDTFYNVLKIGEMELDDNGRPLYPPKIKSIRIVDNPFDDIVPRITAAEKRVQQRAKIQAQKEREEAERRRGAKKNAKLLSFGADEDEGGQEPSIKKKAIFRPDLVEDGPSSAVPDFVSKPVLPLEPERKAESKTETKSLSKNNDKDDITKIREKHAQEQASEEKSRKSEIAKMEAEIRKLTKRHDNDSDEEVKRKKPRKSYLEEELAKYAKGRGKHKKGKDGKRKDESDVLSALNSFRDKLQSQKWSDGEDNDVTMCDESKAEEGTKDEGSAAAGEEEPGMEVDDDFGFMNHALHFPKDNGEETQKAERDYEVIDPRQRGAKAREEEKERRRVQKAGRGGNRR